ncbi:hypothetical protein H6S82_17450 [Planktothrix sp. FACHB-1355]|uniref:Uncharacterized protein n=1 Tax=Aerosakkonema funiforme FACHB-1375 TaxID=2949571 RepID=A0A926ZHI6_9CYAN|nr:MULTISPECIES: hypothetical protein [Oscillatoriales]MBD2183323.1 hypothetical protein [Aerosakkonema funiforme FACHB-1375]MBD3560624.1 hypothetical protein [Planktothrix sp. FACHB-1355]
MSILYPVLDDFLPDYKVKEDLLNILWEDDLECEIDLETGKIKVPRDTLLEVISKSYRQNNYQIGFGNYYAAQVAIGGVKKQESGILYPVYCFATLFYNRERDVITTDVHPEMR